jgi:hypothetical protein
VSDWIFWIFLLSLWLAFVCLIIWDTGEERWRQVISTILQALLSACRSVLKWRVAAAVVTVFLPLILFMRLSDRFSKLLLPKETLTGAPSFEDLKLLAQPEQSLADWAGQINFMGLTIFLTSLCVFIVTSCIVIIFLTLKSHDDYSSAKKFKSWQSITRTALVCIFFFLIASASGVIFGWNGPAPPIDENCYPSVASFVAAEEQIEKNALWLRFDDIGEYIFEKKSTIGTFSRSTRAS